VRWRGYKFGFHTDVQKMYNSVRLDSSHWCLQRYLWQEQLEPDETIIYGVKSSGNQAEHGLRETAKIFQDQYPEVNRIASEDIYVDDCMSGSSTINSTLQITDQLELVLTYGGFTFKSVTISGTKPRSPLSADGITVSVAGLKWHSQDDLISLDIKDIVEKSSILSNKYLSS